MNLKPPPLSFAPLLAEACTTLKPEQIVNHDIPQIIYAEDMPNELYHAQPSLSNSRIKNLADKKQPIDFWASSWMNPHAEPWEKTQAFKFGQAAHMLVLEGEDMFNKNWNITEGKNGQKSKTTTLDGHLAGEEYDILLSCRDALLSHPIASKVLAGAKSEVSMFCTLPVMFNSQAPNGRGFMVDVPVRVRHDIWKPSYSADLKFVESLDGLRDVGKQIASYGYDQQAELYPRVMAKCDPTREHQNFVTIFVEKRKQHPKVLCVAYESSVISTAKMRNDYAMEKFAKLVHEHGPHTPWPSFPNRVHTVWPEGEGNGDIELPSWWNYL